MSDTYRQQSAPAPPPYAPQAPPPGGGSNGLATAGFVLALLGLLGAWIPLLNIFGIILAVLGLILAGIGLARSRRSGAGKGLSIAGLVLGGLALVIAVVINVAFVGAVDEVVNEATDTTVDAPAGSGAQSRASAGSAGEDRGATRDNPAPLGSKITGGDWTVTVNSVKTAGADSLGQKPAAGSTLLVVNLTATYNGDDSQGSTPWATVDFVTAEGTTIDATSGSTLFVPDKQFDSLKTVYAGASVKGDQMLEVPENWKSGVLAVSPDIISDDTFLTLN